MSNGIQKDVLTKTSVVYHKPEMDQVIVRRDLEYKTSFASHNPTSARVS